MPLTTRVWGASKVLFLCGALLLTYVLFAAAAMRMALKTRDVAVPELCRADRQRGVGSADGLGPGAEGRRRRKVDPKVPAGQILAQDPAAGARTRRQRSVRVWISAGPRSTTVPRLVGESERTAQLRVAQDGLHRRRNGRDSLARLYGRRGGRAESAGQEQVGHDFAARQSGRARRDLCDAGPHRRQRRPRRRPAADSGFRVAVVGDHPYPGVPGGVVLRQSPQAGFQIAPGEPISLEVSR